MSSNPSLWTLSCLLLLLSTASVSAFSTPASASTSRVDIGQTAPRNIFGMQEWAKTSGVESCKGFRLTSDPVDEQDWSVSTTKSLSVNEVVVTVPSQIILSSNDVIDTQINLQQAEVVLEENDLEDQIPLFRLYVNLLLQYELGDQSPYFPWLNSLPRRFYNGVMMTSACFECLPPYVRYIAEKECYTSQCFQQALQYAEAISEMTMLNTDLLNWAYCVAVTRSFGVNTGADNDKTCRVIVPMADYLNHGSFENEVELTFDQDGNCIVYAARDVSPGTPLRLCYGDPTNPSIFFATYGFLDKSSPATFCKLMHLQQEMAELKLDFSDLLFYKDTGEISPQVWDLLLYSILKQEQQVSEEDLLQGFYDAYAADDVDTKNLYHQHYFQHTLQALHDHVDGMLNELESLSELAKTLDIAKHPRLSLIKQHNDFVKTTFLKVKANLNAMSSGDQ